MGDFDGLDDRLVAAGVHRRRLPLAWPTATEVVADLFVAILVITDNRAVQTGRLDLAVDHLLAPLPHLGIAGHAALQGDVLPLEGARNLADDGVALGGLLFLLNDLMLGAKAGCFAERGFGDALDFEGKLMSRNWIHCVRHG